MKYQQPINENDISILNEIVFDIKIKFFTKFLVLSFESLVKNIVVECKF